MARVVERTFKKQGITVSTGTPVENVEAGKKLGQVHLRRRVGRGRLPLHRRWPRPRHRGAGPGRGRGRDRRGRQDQDRRVPADLEPEGLRDRRPGARPGARPQGDRRRAWSRSSTHRRRSRPTRSTSTWSPARPSATRRWPASASPRPQAKEAGHDVKVGKLKLGGVGAATVYDDRDGIVKLVVDSKYGEILGAHIVGNRACDMIAELVATMALEGGYQELARIVHPHPTISEAVLDAARAVDGWATRQTPSGATRGLLLRPRVALRVPGRRAVSGLFTEAGLEQPEWQPILLGGLFQRFGRDSWANGPERDEGMRRGRAAGRGLRAAADRVAASRGRATRCSRCGPRPSPSRPVARSPSPWPPSARPSPPGAT